MNRKIKIEKIFIIIILLLSLIALSLSITAIILNSNEDIYKLYKKSLSSVVEVRASSKDVGDSFGTAVYIENNKLVTNAHVVTFTQLGVINEFEEISIRLASQDDYIKVKLEKYDIQKDIAVLRLLEDNNNLVPIKTMDSSKLKAGEKVFAIGNTSNFGIGISAGIVSVPLVKITYDDIQREVIQSDITISGGNSGGALIDKKGRLIGITTFRVKDNSGNVIYGIAYSIPINLVMGYIKN